MELVSEGKNFRLARKEELPEILEFLEKHLPDSLKGMKRGRGRWNPLGQSFLRSTGPHNRHMNGPKSLLESPNNPARTTRVPYVTLRSSTP
uniref:Uncharacterized protein n=1 Tax=Timema shepardi TaxID=629360 RepID=A0A7R9AL40_TIMSH|nr:unnamed protein product [Timema shepardi]